MPFRYWQSDNRTSTAVLPRLRATQKGNLARPRSRSPQAIRKPERLAMHCHLHRGDWSFHLTNEKKKKITNNNSGDNDDDSNDSNNNDNDDDEHFEFFFFLQSPHCASNCLHKYDQVNRAIVCKSRSDRSTPITCNTSCAK